MTSKFSSVDSSASSSDRNRLPINEGIAKLRALASIRTFSAHRIPFDLSPSERKDRNRNSSGFHTTDLPRSEYPSSSISPSSCSDKVDHLACDQRYSALEKMRQLLEKDRLARSHLRKDQLNEQRDEAFQYLDNPPEFQSFLAQISNGELKDLYLPSSFGAIGPDCAFWIFFALAKNPSVISLNMYDLKIGDIDRETTQPFFRYASSLRYLELGKNMLTQKTCSTLEAVIFFPLSLEHLGLSHSNFETSQKYPESSLELLLRQLTNLKSLDLSCCNLGSGLGVKKLLQTIFSLPHLVRLDIRSSVAEEDTEFLLHLLSANPQHIRSLLQMTGIPVPRIRYPVKERSYFLIDDNSDSERELSGKRQIRFLISNQAADN